MHRQFVGNLTRGILVTVVFFILLGLLYPLAETGIGQALFHFQVNGSLTANGSTRVGQNWKGPQWFHGRPDSDDPMVTGGSNLGPRSKTLEQDAAAQIAQLKKEGITPTTDLVTTSGSNIDPDIAPVDAYAQVNAVAKARGIPAAKVNALVASHIQGAELGFLGSPYIDVLQLNEALAKL